MGASPSLWLGTRRTNAYKFNSAAGRPSLDNSNRSLSSHPQSSLTVDCLTDYEKSLLPNLWNKAIEDNPNFCSNVYGRFLSLCPEMRPIFRLSPHCLAKRQSDVTDRDVFQPLATRLSAFLTSLIEDLASDADNTIERCRQLGALHASFVASSSRMRTMEVETMNKSLVCIMSFALPSIPPTSSKSKGTCRAHIPAYAWSAFAEALTREFEAAFDCSDVDERELQLLAWSHFVEVISAAVADAYEANSLSTR